MTPSTPSSSGRYSARIGAATSVATSGTALILRKVACTVLT
ncbi:hypothetical protein [Pseudonocardia abyssalis]|nr:hypothetical protein [Pseudonocardia abyssalis]